MAQRTSNKFTKLDDDESSIIKKKITQLIIKNMSRKELKNHNYALMLFVPQYLIHLIMLYKINPMIKIKLLFIPTLLLNQFDAKIIKITKCVTVQNIKNNFQLSGYHHQSGKTKWFMKFDTSKIGTCHIHYQKSFKHGNGWIDCPERDCSVPNKGAICNKCIDAPRSFMGIENEANDKWRLKIQLATVSSSKCKISMEIFDREWRKVTDASIQMTTSSINKYSIYLKYETQQSSSSSPPPPPPLSLSLQRSPSPSPPLSLLLQKSLFNGILLIETYKNDHYANERNIQLKSSDFAHFECDYIVKHWKE